MLEYIILVTFLVFFLTFVYLKLTYPFWNNQPVYHPYDIWRWFGSTPYTIYKYRPVKTKFCDFEHIFTLSYVDCDAQSMVVDLLQCYYIPTDQILHTILANDLHALCSGQRHGSFVSIYAENEYRQGNDDNKDRIISAPKLAGCICSRQLTFYFREHFETPIYFMDFLCVRPGVGDTTLICRKLIQTHEYNQRIANPAVTVSLLKKEIKLLDGIVPIVSYSTYIFYLRNRPIPELLPHMEVVFIADENKDLLIEMVYDPKTRRDLGFDIFVLPDIGNLITQIQAGLLHVFCLRNKKHVLAMYFIKDPKMQYEDVGGGDSLQLAGSIANIRSSYLFYLGFLHGLLQILHRSPNYKILGIENLGHNRVLLSQWREHFTPIFENRTAYYTFNLVCPGSPFSGESCFALT